ncbi:MAG: VapC toxin family PIN domain ribonuclease [Acidobacteria bacterium]|nr:MAG: VapC toxin family PIN domain ribonuclease [Acidobacteriota bacterium]PYV77662.1 MAG: VapC toxin family PIN domain ribonuclease [Acidobacteriota bacterium]
MEPRYLLDTNICIYIRQKRSPDLLHRFEKLRPGEAVISLITFGELLFGAEKSAHRTAALERLRELQIFLSVLPLPEASAGNYGKIRAELESKGEIIGNNDLWIASHALSSGLILVTNNEREFSRVRGLRTQNWAT